MEYKTNIYILIDRPTTDYYDINIDTTRHFQVRQQSHHLNRDRLVTP